MSTPERREASKSAVIFQCIGEAHSNPYIDNCSICSPYWGTYPACPLDGKKLSTTGWCSKCRKHFTLHSQLSDVKQNPSPKAE